MRVVLSTGRKELVAQTEDVSFTGVLVRMDLLLPVRQLVRLRLTLLPEGDALAVMGMVARHSPAVDGLPPGMGIQFYALAQEQRDRWNRFIRFVASGLGGDSAPTKVRGVAGETPLPALRLIAR